MSSITRKDDFSRGIDNVSSPNKLRPTRSGAFPVADALNVDFFSDGRIATRLFLNKVSEFEVFGDVAIPYRGRLVTPIKDGEGNTFIASVDMSTSTAYPLPTDLPPEPYRIKNAVVHNDVLYMELRSEYESTFVSYDGVLVRPWGVAPPPRMVGDVVSAPSMARPLTPGKYRVAFTRPRPHSTVEPTPSNFTTHVVSAGSMLVVSPTEPSDVWCSSAEGNTLYLVGTASDTTPLNIDGGNTFSGQSLPPQQLRPPMEGSIAVSYNACILVASGRFLYKSMPFRPHVFDAVAGFLQFDAPISAIAVVSGGVYVQAGSVYFIRGLDTTDLQQKTVTVGGAPLPGSLCGVDSETVMWAALDGFVAGDGNGAAKNMTGEWFTPKTIGYTASGVLRRRGQRFFLVSAKPSMTDTPPGPGMG